GQASCRVGRGFASPTIPRQPLVTNKEGMGRMVLSCMLGTGGVVVNDCGNGDPMSEKKKKVRVELRKNRSKPPRGNDLTRAYQEDAGGTDDSRSTERVRAKGDLSRYRTVVQNAADSTGKPVVDAECLRGRVLRVHGLQSIVEVDDGRVFRCAIRRLLKSLATDERNVVTTGDVVWVRPAPVGSGNPTASQERSEVDDLEAPEAEEAASLSLSPSPLPNIEGMIERIEPRHGVLTRSSRRREHVLVANVDQVAIVVSLVQPDLKPHLIDRYLAAAQQGKLKPVLCLNKADLADPVALQPLVGAYAQLGVPVLLTSAKTGLGIGRLREQLRGRATVFSGQSGVGKSSLLNAVEPGLGLAVKSVSEVNSKGRHTTTYTQLIKLAFGGWVVDTPGVRQLQLWDVRPEEVEGYFPEFRPYVSLCDFPDCTHTHEAGCAVKAGIASQQISPRRYHSYLGLFHGIEE
ncbi:MAG TPA: ribosome small subunit-dependent GTPase A, partial [Gemmata sp.]|nr:ribosome small subunit-dependent GTPase A [Gemmata sp.]